MRYITIVRIWLCFLWCQSPSHHYFCAKIIWNYKKKIPFRKMLLLIGWKDRREELNSDSKLKEVFFLNPSQICSNQSISPGFWSIWCWMLHVHFFWVALWGYIASKYLLFIALFMSIYSKGVYILTLKWFCVCPKVVVTKWLAPYV